MGLRAGIDRNGKTAAAVLALIALAGVMLKTAAWMRGLSLLAWLFVPAPWIAVAFGTLAVAVFICRVVSMSVRPPDIHSLSAPQVLVLRVLALKPHNFVTPHEVTHTTHLSDVSCESAAIQLERQGLITRSIWPGRAYSLTDAGIKYVDQHNLGPQP